MYRPRVICPRAAAKPPAVNGIYAAVTHGDKITVFLRDSTTYPKLNLPPVRLRAERRGADIYVWDDIRGRFLFLTPEEWVRRHVLAFLISQMGADKYCLSQEYPVTLGGMSQRADIVWISSGRPFMLVECKAPGVAIDGAVFAQAVRYNSVVGAKYVMLSNGLDTRVYQKTQDGEYSRTENPAEIRP